MVGQQIKAYLTENGIKQCYLAEKVDIPAAVLSQMLAGSRRIDITEYVKICQALKVNFKTFIENDLKKS